MPTYQYRCKECGHEFEKRQRMNDDPVKECPKCGSSVRRVVGKVGIVFKGSGFYVTDNRSSNGKGRVKTTEKVFRIHLINPRTTAGPIKRTSPANLTKKVNKRRP